MLWESFFPQWSWDLWLQERNYNVSLMLIYLPLKVHNSMQIATFLFKWKKNVPGEFYGFTWVEPCGAQTGACNLPWLFSDGHPPDLERHWLHHWVSLNIKCAAPFDNWGQAKTTVTDCSCNNSTKCSGLSTPEKAQACLSHLKTMSKTSGSVWQITSFKVSLSSGHLIWAWWEEKKLMILQFSSFIWIERLF